MGTRVTRDQFKPIPRKPMPDVRPYAPQILERVLANSEAITETGCWIWLEDLTGGYAITHMLGKTWRVHRLVYAALKGPFDPNLVICHRCDVRCCVNPDHLRADTQLENMLEASRNKRWGAVQYQTHCKRGHPYAPSDGTRSRECHECSRIRARELYAERKARGLIGEGAPRTMAPRNPKRVRLIEYLGESLCVLDWSIRLGISSTAMSQRIRKYGDHQAIAMGGRSDTRR